MPPRTWPLRSRSPVRYVDYAPSVEDILALCMTGFPSFEHKSTHRRSLIYLGPSTIRSPGETRPSMFTDQRATDMAATAGIQINVISPSGQENNTLRTTSESTGGQYFRIDPSGADLSAQLDSIRSNDRIPRCLTARHCPAGSATRRRSRWRWRWRHPCRCVCR